MKLGTMSASARAVTRKPKRVLDGASIRQSLRGKSSQRNADTDSSLTSATPKTPLSSKTYSTAEVCRMLGVHRHTLRLWCKALHLTPEERVMTLHIKTHRWPDGLIKSLVDNAPRENKRLDMVRRLQMRDENMSAQ